MIVSLSGTDGTGKTTTAKNLVAVLREQGVRCEYRHEYDYVLLRYPLALLGSERLEAERGQLAEEIESDEPNPSLRHRLWIYLVFLDALALWTWYRIVGYRKVVLLDRYVYDQYVSFHRLGVGGPILRWLCRHFPRADEAFFLRVDPMRAYERSKETHAYPPSFYSEAMECYEDLGDALGVTFIDTNEDETETLRQALETLLENERFRERAVTDMRNNRTLRRFIDEYGPFEALADESAGYDEREARIGRTLDDLESVLDDVAWVLLKTRLTEQNLPTYDLDLLVHERDLDRAGSALEAAGYRRTSEDERWKTNFKRDGRFKVSLHTRVGWEGIDYVDATRIFRESTVRSYLGREVQVPDAESAVLIHLSHMLFELTTIRKEDFDHVAGLLERTDLETVLDRARDQGWERGCRRLLERVVHLDRRLAEGASCRFPHPIPLRTIGLGLLERVRAVSGPPGTRLRLVPTVASELFRFGLWRLAYRSINVAVFRDHV